MVHWIHLAFIFSELSWQLESGRDLDSHHSLSEWGLGLLYQSFHSYRSTRTSVDGVNPSIQILDLLGSRPVLESKNSFILMRRPSMALGFLVIQIVSLA